MSIENSVREDIVLALGSDYDIVRELGRGGASVVYLARDRVLGREVAIKVIRDSQTGDAEAVARFEREARTLASLQHPNIVMLYGAKQLPSGSLALVMQHGEWSTLKAVIREQGPLPIEAVQQVLRDLAAALIYLHRHQVIHRDIKPENIFIEAETGRALLSDFGIAKSGDARTSVTLTGVVIGTPAYMSPEQIDGGELTGRSDLYSLGMVGYEMLTGVRPWDGESLFGVIYKQKTEKLPSLLQHRPDAPQQLRALIEKATEKAPEARWGSADEFVSALSGPMPAPVARGWAEAPSSDEHGMEPTEYPTLEIEQALVDQAFADGQRGLRRKQRFLAAAVVVLLFSGGAGALAFSGREPGPDAGVPYDATLTAGTASEVRQDYLSLPDPIRVDTARFALDEPIVDSAPPPAATPRRAGTTSSVPTGGSVGQTAAAATAARVEEASEPELPLGNPGAPPQLLPELSVTRPGGASPRMSTSAIVEARPGSAATAAPQLRNRERIGQLLAERYPRDLRERGIGGTAVLAVLVTSDGSVENSTIVTSSGDSRLDAAAMAVASRMVFSVPPGGNRQPAWVSVPLMFQPR